MTRTTMRFVTTLSELEARARGLLDEETAAQWSQANLRRWFNDGLRDLARTTRHFKSQATVAVTSGVAEYTLASNIIAVEHAYHDDGTTKRPLIAKHWESMDQVWGYHQDIARGYPQFFATWGYSPNLKIRLYPVPQTTGHNVRLLTSILPTEMPTSGDDSTEVDVPPAWVDLLVDYARYSAFLRDRDPGWQQALQMYEAKRDSMIYANDYLAVNRELVPDPMAGYVPLWHLADDWY
jgi:hypothetical protein